MSFSRRVPFLIVFSLSSHDNSLHVLDSGCNQILGFITSFQFKFSVVLNRAKDFSVLKAGLQSALVMVYCFVPFLQCSSIHLRLWSNF